MRDFRDFALHFTYASYCFIAPAAILLFGYLVPYLIDVHHIRKNGVKGPLFARLTNAWLTWITARGDRSEVVHELHKAYGTFVRLAPNHVSVGDPKALKEIYGHGNGTLKSDFYDAFVSTNRGIFSTRSRAEHARKRRLISHIYSQRSILDFEPLIRLHVGSLIRQWDCIYIEGMLGHWGNDGKNGWQGREGRVWFDCLSWYNYLAFDIIGELALGSPFGMVERGNDTLPTTLDRGKYEISKDDPQLHYETGVSAIEVLAEREEFSNVLGCMPPFWRPFVRLMPWLSHGTKAAGDLTKLADVAVSNNLSTAEHRADVLSKLQASRDDNGLPMGKNELVAEIITQLIAGSESTSSTICAMTYYLAQNPRVQEKLHNELDDNLTLGIDHVASYEQAKHLPYLEAVINETFRLFSTSAIGLPREVPEDGLTVLGKSFPPGTVLSAPSYTVHRCEAIWGEDVDTFRPERWLGRNSAEMHKTLNPFSYGPRACIGRNLAVMELLIIAASIFCRYDFVLQNQNRSLQVRDGFLRRPLSCFIGLRRREKTNSG